VEPHDERGQAVPLVLLALVLAVLGVAAVGRVAADAADAARARTAADAAALAAVHGGRPAAVALAEANGATLVSLHDEGTDVVVVVACGDARATARATAAPP
jgi:hypothetical protein